jgi:hypothetical protein
VLLVDALSHHRDFMAPLRSSKVPVGLRAGMGHDDNDPTPYDNRSAVGCIAPDCRTSGDTSKGWLRVCLKPSFAVRSWRLRKCLRLGLVVEDRE